MDGNYEYFMRTDLGKYVGEWVIIAKEKIVANGSSKEMKEALDRIRKEYPGETPFIAKVPQNAIQIV
jgi:hypothetical protein